MPYKCDFLLMLFCIIERIKVIVYIFDRVLTRFTLSTPNFFIMDFFKFLIFDLLVYIYLCLNSEVNGDNSNLTYFEIFDLFLLKKLFMKYNIIYVQF